jgi:LmbE family N-acetylglucosaminyl deacetylase
MTGTVLHFAPHPDDELIGAPATLMELRDAGYRIVNVACGLGKPEQRSRREAELREASRLARFELLVPKPSPIESSDKADAASAAVLELVRATIAELEPEIVVSPSPHDRHPRHELVARAVRDALREDGSATPCWWMWGLWAPLPLPTLGTVFARQRLEEILAALGAYQGELERNDYRRLVRGRAEMNASLGPELLCGFGASAAQASPYVELLTEVFPVEGRWLLGPPRWLDPTMPLAEPTDTDVGEWLMTESLTDRLGTLRSQDAPELS